MEHQILPCSSARLGSYNSPLTIAAPFNSEPLPGAAARCVQQPQASGLQNRFPSQAPGLQVTFPQGLLSFVCA